LLIAIQDRLTALIQEEKDEYPSQNSRNR
jgi:hypothetical protein